jgi:hypothetical protein
MEGSRLIRPSAWTRRPSKNLRVESAGGGVGDEVAKSRGEAFTYAPPELSSRDNILKYFWTSECKWDLSFQECEYSYSGLLRYDTWYYGIRPPQCSSSQSFFWLQIQRSRVRFPELPDFLRSSGSGMGSTQPREDNWGATWRKSSGSRLENRD